MSNQTINNPVTDVSLNIITKELIFVCYRSFHSDKKNKTYNTINFLQLDKNAKLGLPMDPFFVDAIPDVIKTLTFGDTVLVDFSLDERMQARFSAVRRKIADSPYKF